MNAHALVSVVIPTYNRVEQLLRALDSVVRQTVRLKEIWVIDDASTDPVEDAVRAFADRAAPSTCPILYERMQVNSGQGACRNRSLRLVSGEWVAFLDDDDWWLPNHVEALQKASAAGASAVVSLAEIRPEGGVHGTKTWGPTPFQMQQAARMLFHVNYVLPSASMFRRDALIELGGIDEAPELRRAEDWDLALRGMEAGWGFASTDTVTVIYTEPDRQALQKRHSTYLAVMHCLVRHKDYALASAQDRRLSLCFFGIKAVLDGCTLGLPSYWAPLDLARRSIRGAAAFQSTALLLLARAMACCPPAMAALLLRLLKRQAAALDAQRTAILSAPSAPAPASQV